MTEVRHVYHEDGGRWLVTVLSDAPEQRGESVFRVVQMRCIKTLRESPWHPEGIPKDRVFTVEGRSDASYVGWYLRPERPEDYELN
jgi:hypothetical protein